MSINCGDVVVDSEGHLKLLLKLSAHRAGFQEFQVPLASVPMRLEDGIGWNPRIFKYILDLRDPAGRD